MIDKNGHAWPCARMQQHVRKSDSKLILWATLNVSVEEHNVEEVTTHLACSVKVIVKESL